MADIVYWDGSLRPVRGNTPFGFFDNDPDFLAEAPGFATWSAMKLGYPAQEIELYDIQMYAAFEEAVNEYSAQVNYQNILNNLFILRGMPLNTDLTNRPVAGNLKHIISLSKKYGTLAGAAGEATWYSSSINLLTEQQTYDLTNILPSGAEIQRIHHYDYPAAMQFYDPYSGMGGGIQNISNEFGWYPNATNYVMTPIYSDLLRIQQLEVSMQIRKSAYTFELNGPMLKIFPIPTRAFPIYFDYMISAERDAPFYENDSIMHDSGSISDFSDVNYQRLQYNRINEPGRQWIRSYAFACILETWGYILSKYQGIPIPDSTVTLNGESFSGNAKELKSSLIEKLKLMLTDTSRAKQNELATLEADAQQNILSKVPTPIFIF